MRKPAVLAALVIAVACTDRIPVTPDLGGPNASISDAVHEAGNTGFYFLPPLVGDPSPTGAFDASLLQYLSVTICSWSGSACLEPPVAEFTAEAGTGSETIRLVLEDEHYIVNWHTDGLASSTTYRIRILAAGTELGHADVDVVDNGAGLRNVDTELYIGLLDGRTLPIKFRIEEGAVFVVGAAGGTILAAAGQVILRIPEDALASPVGITVKPGGTASSEEGTIPGTLWEFGPDGTEFGVPAELTIGYAPDALPPDLADPATSLVLATQEDGEWIESPTTVDATGHFVTGPVFGFSVKAVAEKTVELDLQPSSLILAPSESAELASSALSRERKILKKRALKKIALDERVAAVDQSGFVRAIGVGSTVLRVTPRLPRLFPPELDPCALPYVLCTFPRRDVPVVVRRPVASVTVSPAVASVVVGSTVLLTAELRDAEGNALTDREVTWTSTSEDVATVDATGLVTGLALGSADVQAGSEGITGLAQIEVTSAGGPGLPTVPAGFAIEVLAHIPQAPVALALAPEGSPFGPDLYVAGRGSDGATSDNIYHVSAGGGVTLLNPLLPEADPVDIEFSPSGSAFGTYLYVSANNRDGGQSGDHGGTIQRIDAFGAVTDFTLVGEASGLTEPRGIAFARGNGFGFDLYVANHVNPPMDVGRVGSGGGAASSFFEGGLALSDLAFGPGGDFGTDLYVADWEGCNCLRRLTADASVSGPVAVLPAAPRALKFGPGGAFGTDLYLAAEGTVYRIGAGGTVTTFAQGFLGVGFDGLEFSLDGGTLYVADQAAGIVYRISSTRREYTWTPLISGTTRPLREIWGASASEVFAAADLFEILRFDGATWSHTFDTPDSLAFAGLSGRAANDVYAAGSRRVDAPQPCGGPTGRTSRAFVLRFDGTAWTDAGFPFVCNSAHRGAWAGPQTFRAVGNSPRTAEDLGDQVGRIWRLRDGSWTLEFTLLQDLSSFLHAWGSGETDVYAVGGGNLFGSPETPYGIIAHYDGTAWAVVADQIEHPLSAVWGTSATDAFAVGQQGLIRHFDGTQWTRQESGVVVNLNGVWGSAPGNVFAVGGGGTILHYDGRTWTRLESGTTTTLTGVWTTTSGDQVFVIGQGGLTLLGTAQP